MQDYKAGHIYFASESVGEGHPDKLCDQISDGILDACIRINPNSKVAMESATKTNMVINILSHILEGRVTGRDRCVEGTSKLRTNCKRRLRRCRLQIT